MQFANKTRQQFVRLLALVKWAASAGRVDKCQVNYSQVVLIHHWEYAKCQAKNALDLILNYHNSFCFVLFCRLYWNSCYIHTYTKLNRQRLKTTEKKGSKITKGKRHKQDSWSHAGYPP